MGSPTSWSPPFVGTLLEAVRILADHDSADLGLILDRLDPNAFLEDLLTSPGRLQEHAWRVLDRPECLSVDSIKSVAAFLFSPQVRAAGLSREAVWGKRAFWQRWVSLPAHTSPAATAEGMEATEETIVAIWRERPVVADFLRDMTAISAMPLVERVALSLTHSWTHPSRPPHPQAAMQRWLSEGCSPSSDDLENWLRHGALQAVEQVWIRAQRPVHLGFRIACAVASHLASMQRDIVLRGPRAETDSVWNRLFALSPTLLQRWAFWALRAPLRPKQRQTLVEWWQAAWPPSDWHVMLTLPDVNDRRLPFLSKSWRRARELWDAELASSGGRTEVSPTEAAVLTLLGGERRRHVLARLAQTRHARPDEFLACLKDLLKHAEDDADTTLNSAPMLWRRAAKMGWIAPRHAQKIDGILNHHLRRSLEHHAPDIGNKAEETEFLQRKSTLERRHLPDLGGTLRRAQARLMRLQVSSPVRPSPQPSRRL